MKFLSYNIQYG